MAEGVEFDEDKFSYSKPPMRSSGAVGFDKHTQVYSPTDGEPRMIQWLIRHGYTRSPAFGRIILLIIVLINAFITYFVMSHFL